MGRMGRRALVAGGVISVFLALAACSSDSDGGGSGSTEPTAQGEMPAMVSDAMAEVTEWPGPEGDLAVPEGKRVTVISCTQAGGGCAAASEGASEAAKKLGWNAKIVDGKYDPTVWNSALRQAVSEGTDGVILVATDPAVLQEGIEKAKAANVPVVSVFAPPFGDAPRVDAYVSVDPEVGGKVLGSYIAWDSDNKANVLVLDDPAYPLNIKRTDNTVDQLKADCPDCKVTRQEFNAATASNTLPTQVTAALQSDPTINYVVPPFDPVSALTAQGIRQAGKTDSAKLIGSEGLSDAFDRMRSGEQDADLATPDTYIGWLGIDTLAAVMTGADVPETTWVPQRLFTTENVGDVTDWDLDLDYIAKFLQRWGK